MSNAELIKRLDLVIYFLENLPKRMCDEMAVREEIRKQNPSERIKADIESFKNKLIK